jgi:hypothetical protein
MIEAPIKIKYPEKPVESTRNFDDKDERILGHPSFKFNSFMTEKDRIQVSQIS